MNRSSAKNKIVISGSLILLLMFLHLVGIIECCEQQVLTNQISVSAFNG